MTTKVNKEDYRTFRLKGPDALRSVVNHHCAALGLHSEREKASLQMEGQEREGRYFLSVRDMVQEKDFGTYEGAATSEGRKALAKDLFHDLQAYLGISPSPWGDLVGVRPMKLFRKKVEQGLTPEEVKQSLIQESALQEQKAALLKETYAVQERYSCEGIHIYGHIPFCTSHCAYCSFPYGLVQDFAPIDAFMEAYKKDMYSLRTIIDKYDLPIRSVYIGGGTPTSLSDDHFEELLDLFSDWTKDKTGQPVEFTVEAGRPDTVTPRKKEALLTHGVMRMSINPQTMQNHILQYIGRGHKVEEITELYEWTRTVDDLWVNMDFILGLPYQVEEHILENLVYVCQNKPENVTIHTLALKKGSPLYGSSLVHEIPSGDTLVRLLEHVEKEMSAMGYEPYYLYRQQYMRGSLENVGYCKKGTACLYNMAMMEERWPILSVGPGTTAKWMRPPDYKQRKMYMPNDVLTYIHNIDALCAKREAICRTFYGED